MDWGVLGMKVGPALVGVAAIALVLTGCAGTPTAAPSAGATGRADATGPSPSPSPSDDWITFTTQDGLASWQQPADWSDTLESVDEMGEATYAVSGPDGNVRLHFMDRIWGLGGPGCIPDVRPAYPYAVVASTDIPLPPKTSGYEGEVPPRVAYETIAFPDHVSAGLGITDSLASVDGTACEFMHMVGTASAAGIVGFEAQYRAADGTWGDHSFATLADAQGYVDTQEYKTLARVLASLRVEDAVSELAGDFVISETADCGLFDLAGQTLTVSGGTATITTPGQVLTGTATNSGGTWDVVVSGADRTTVHLTGTVSAGVYSGTGDYGGIHPNGETGWDCQLPSFSASSR